MPVKRVVIGNWLRVLAPPSSPSDNSPSTSPRALRTRDCRDNVRWRCVSKSKTINRFYL